MLCTVFDWSQKKTCGLLGKPHPAPDRERPVCSPDGSSKNDAYHEKKLVQLVWDNIVDLLGDHADADILVLLDADDAGRVMKGKSRFRDRQLRKSFAVISGTPEGKSCCAPGEHSLTSLTARAFDSHD